MFAILLTINGEVYILVWFISLQQHLSTEEHYFCISCPPNVVPCTNSNHSSHSLEYKEDYFCCSAPSIRINCNIGDPFTVKIQQVMLHQHVVFVVSGNPAISLAKQLLQQVGFVVSGNPTFSLAEWPSSSEGGSIFFSM